MNSLKNISIIIFTVLITGCATGLNTQQQREYYAFEHDGVLIEEKSTTTATWLGLLPGGGSFYAREPGLGTANLLLWPLSMVWDPVSGRDGAMAINYDITKYHLEQKKAKEITILDEQLFLNDIDRATYVFSKRKIDDKYDYK